MIMNAIMRLLTGLLLVGTVLTARAADIPFTGEGTSESPYLLSTKEDIINLGKLTSAFTDAEYAVVNTFPDSHFKITNDIDLEYSEEFHGISVIANRYAWQSTVVFAGHIDGGGHTIHRMKVGEVQFEVSPEESEDGYAHLLGSAYQLGTMAFIGRLSGTLENLNIAADCRIVGYSQTGGLVGEARSGALIQNCRNYADVKSYASGVGGIVADLLNGAKVVDCYNAGHVTTGMLIAGGIAGRSAGVIMRCANAGDVQSLPLNHNVNLDTNPTLMQLVGGICGDVLTGNGMRECVNAGYVHGYTKVGGLCSIIPSASNCLNIGLVSGYDKYTCGQVFGEYNSKYVTYLENLYYDNQITIHGIGGGIIDLSYCYGKSVSELTSGTPLDGFDTEIWDFTEGKYPVLAQFASEPRLAQLRTMVVKPAGSQTITAIGSDMEIANVEGLEWSLSSKDYASLIPGKMALKSPRPADAAVTLTATMSDAVKVLPLKLTEATALDTPECDLEVVETIYYDLQGVRLPKAPEQAGAYITVSVYSDGSTSVNKAIK